jgi:phenylacetate-CoA ligase
VSSWTTVLGAAACLARLRRSQYWSAERLAHEQQSRLARTLRAAAAIPFYRARWEGALRPSDLARLPVLARADVAELNRSVRSLHSPDTTFLCDRSSGSTGMPAEFLFDESHQRGRIAARARYLLENGWNPLQRFAWIVNVWPGGASPDGKLAANPLLWRARFLFQTAEFSEQLDWLERLDPAFLYTYPSNFEGIATLAEQRGWRPRALRQAFSGAEVLDDAIRARAERVLGVGIADNYGSTETFIAWQCPRGSYHVNAEHVFVEVVDEDGRPTPAGQMGRVLVTTLENSLMPLVRYAIGDYAVMAGGACDCGRTLPLLGRVVGRGINLFRARDGRLISPWDLVGPLKRIDALRQFQIVQHSIDRFTVRYVAEGEIASDALASIHADLARLLGYPVSVAFERRDTIPRAPSGKFMTALCEIPL